MLLQLTKMALAESAVQVKYCGKKAFAAVVVDADGGADSSPAITLGVSDTSLAEAATNAVACFTGAADSTVNHIVAAIKNCSGGTVGGDDEISIGDFDCRLNCDWGAKSVYDASKTEYIDNAGTTTNYRNDWADVLTRDNDADSVGRMCVRIPPARMGSGPVGIRMITGMMSSAAAETAITNGITRNIRDDDGNILWYVTDATPTSAELKFDLGDIVVWPFPVVVEEVMINQSTNYAEADYTTTAILWGFPPNNR